MTVLRAFLRAWGDLLRPRILGLALAGVGLTIALFLALQTAIFWLIRLFTPGSLTLPWLGTIEVGNVLSWGSLALFPLMGFFLMAPVAAGFAGLFAERVTDAVEQTHYPAFRGQGTDFLDGLLESLAVMGAVLLVGIGSLILAPFLGPLAPLLFYGANGWLLGREFFQMTARRHLDEVQATALRRRNGAAVTLAGVLVAVGLTIPIVNIAVPLLAAATFAHLFHLIRESDDPDSRYGRG